MWHFWPIANLHGVSWNAWHAVSITYVCNKSNTSHRILERTWQMCSFAVTIFYCLSVFSCWWCWLELRWWLLTFISAFFSSYCCEKLVTLQMCKTILSLEIIKCLENKSRINIFHKGGKKKADQRIEKIIYLHYTHLVWFLNRSSLWEVQYRQSCLETSLWNWNISGKAEISLSLCSVPWL